MKARQIDTVVKTLAAQPKEQMMKSLADILWCAKFTDLDVISIMRDMQCLRDNRRSIAEQETIDAMHNIFVQPKK